MLRTGSIAAAIAAFAAIAGSAATIAPPDATGSGPAPAIVRVTECASGPQPKDRGVEFRGAMRRVFGTERMWMRFTLHERVGRGPYEKVRAPGLGVWRRSRAGVRRFVYRQGVLELLAGMSYRATVHFRWYDAEGEVIRRVRRRSRVCRQRGNLPNLRVARIGVQSIEGRTDLVRYAIRVVNRGRAVAPPSEVGLAVDGEPVDIVELGSLEPDRSRRAFVNGPPCSTSVQARVDPRNLVRESSEGDNVRTVPCPIGP